MRNFFFILFFSSLIGYSQTITIDNTTNSPLNLANILLSGSCITPTNASISSDQSVAYFNRNGSSFLLDEGVIIRNGIAQFTQGIYSNTNLSSQINTNSDADLQNISNSSGQTAAITDIAFLQFDFIPISNNFNFNFLFASNEYGEFQCGFSDVFAFLLTDLTTGITTNLAIIPGTNTPVSVKDIRNNLYNSACISVNSNLFSTYNVTNPAASSLNMRGFTTVLNASAATIPNNPYRIRLVIGDYNDSQYDSAVFISAGSFNSSINLGEDASICSGNTTTITSGLTDPDFTHTWTLNGTIILPETSNTLTVSQPGTYTVTATKLNTNCLITDTIVFNELAVSNPINLFACNDNSATYLYNLTQNNAALLGINPAEYQIFYYNSIANVVSNTPIPASELNTYVSAGNETIYIKLFNTTTNTFCIAQYSFDLLLIQDIPIAQPDDIELCNTAPTLALDLTTQNAQILNGLSSNGYNIRFFNTEIDALNNTNTIGNITFVSLATSPRTIWVRVTSALNTNCFNTTSFQIIVHPLPIVDTIGDVIACSSFTLPPITNGTYYDGPNGTGNQLNPNDIITDIGTYYIFSGPDANGCTNQSDFTVLLLDDYGIEDLDHCESFTVPFPPAGNFYTQPGGPNGTGVVIPPGTLITQNQTIHLYIDFEGVVCKDEAYPISIFPSPPVDDLDDVVTCVSYTLQPLTNGNYFTGPGGTGTPLFAGNMITSSGVIYIYNNDGCSNQSDFNIAIISQPIPVENCGGYQLPALASGNYYTQIAGQGTIIPAGTVITTSQTLYVYAITTTAPNCTSTYVLPITIKPVPVVDNLDDVFKCVGEPFQLPPLSNGTYYTAPNAGGSQLNAGTFITTNQTIYIYDIIDTCPAQTDFNVTFIPLPLVDNLTDVFVCDSFILPDLNYGVYYTQPAGQGNLIPFGTEIATNQIIYIYNESALANGCYTESFFEVNILGVDIGEFDDINACETYTLPPLAVGNYYWQTGGVDPINASDFTFNTPGTYTVHVYDINGDRIVCEYNKSFTITITPRVTLSTPQNIVRCESYTLPPLDTSNYNVNYYRSPGGIDLINPSDYTINTPGTYTIYIYATDYNNPNCFDQKSFVLTINPLQDLNISDIYVCVDPITSEILQPTLINTSLNPSQFTVNWYYNSNLVFTGPAFAPQELGAYTIETIKLAPNNGTNCNYNTKIFTVSPASFAIAEAIVSLDFEDVASITINVINGFGTYEYQLDNTGPYQLSNVFINVSSGDHIIKVRNVLGICNEITLNATVLKYPRFFTPNGDGINDTWNIWDLRNNQSAVVDLYDRYGKFIKKFRTTTFGWDGKLNNYELPSTDYWFVVKYLGKNNEKKIFKAHFSMKR